MSRSAKVAFDWADGNYTFRLGIKELLELQEKCDAGPAFILGRLIDGTWRIQDIRETIRLGLIGGGLEPIKALAVMKNYVTERPLLENILPAQAILNAALVGVEDEPLGKAEGESEMPVQHSPEENSDLPLFMEAAQ
jgi:hypothetical protein